MACTLAVVWMELMVGLKWYVGTSVVFYGTFCWLWRGIVKSAIFD
jgi:hypothetical protein